MTGRTHQIRVHLASIGHAVAGDPMYATGVARRGPDGLERMFLHSWRIEFASPSRRHADPGGGAAATGARVRARDCAMRSSR